MDMNASSIKPYQQGLFAHAAQPGASSLPQASDDAESSLPVDMALVYYQPAPVEDKGAPSGEHKKEPVRTQADVHEPDAPPSENRS